MPRLDNGGALLWVLDPWSEEDTTEWSERRVADEVTTCGSVSRGVAGGNGAAGGGGCDSPCRAWLSVFFLAFLAAKRSPRWGKKN